MSIPSILLLQAAQIVLPVESYDITPAGTSVDLPAISQCEEGEPSGDIIVCSERDDDRYRLPLPSKRDPRRRLRGEAQTGMDAITPDAPCGIFAGQRRCSKQEAAEYGYGEGRDPVTFLSRVVKKVSGDE